MADAPANNAAPDLIYIDLNHWVGLSKARLGHADSGAYADSLLELRAAVASGQVVVPLSSVHYFEMSRIASAQRRADLAPTIGEISKYTVLTHREAFLKHEFRCSLAQELGKSYSVPAPAVTGYGFAHAFGMQGGRGRLRGDPAVQERLAGQAAEFIPRLEEHTAFGWKFVPSGRARTPLELVNEALDGSAQFQMLMGPEDKQDPELLKYGFNPASAYAVVDRITRREADLAEQLAADPKWLQRLDDIIEARAIYWDLSEDWDDAVGDVWARVISMDEFGLDRLRRILHGIPIVEIESAIRRANFRNSSHAWRKNDIHDSDFAGSAVTYCGAVLTEKHLNAVLRGQGFDRKHGTIIMRAPGELTDFLRRRLKGRTSNS